MNDSQPNILLFVMDGMQGQLARPNHPCHTPHFDSIAAGGMRFANAYTPSPTCSPARASLMTGLLPHNHGVLQVEHAVDADQCVLRADKAHWAQHLERAGYATGYFGKWHIERSDELAQFGWRDYQVLGRDTHRAHSQQGGAADVPLDPALTRYQEGPEGYNPILHYGVTDVPASQRSMGKTAQRALDYLQAQEEREEPWCCCASYYDPNEAMIVSRTAFEKIDIDTIELPATLRDDFSDRPGLYRRQQQIFSNLSEREWRHALACYYGRIAELDEQFGRLLGYLEESGQLENTLIIITADHGKYVGAHGMDGHNYGPFEEVYNIPLIVAGPGVKTGVETPARVGLHDIGPTLLDLVGAESLQEADSRSFAPVLSDPAQAKHFTTGYAENHGNRFVLTQRILWDGPWKFAFNGFDFDELYHLQDDPHETKNLAADLNYAEKVKELMAKVWDRVRESGDQALYHSNYYTMRMGAVGPNPS
jgi:arylsulfatase A-like enzyme